MDRTANTLLLFLLIFAGLLGLLMFSVPEGNTGFAWWIWLGAAAITLSATAMELTLLAVWVLLRTTRQLKADPYVPLTLTQEQRQQLDIDAPPVAMLMPAHREVSHPEDAAAFVARIVDLLLKTPAYADLFLLFDSPRSEQQREHAAVAEIGRQLTLAGRPEYASRLKMEEYREKPRAMRNKPGSIHLWLERYADRYAYLFMLDADSSLLEEDPARPETCDALRRLVYTLEQHPQLAMVQSAIHVHTEPTLWGWFQQAGIGMASEYHGQLFKWILEGQVPSYGHNNLYRTCDFTSHVRNTLSYLSHDFLDAADIETAGRKCIQTYHVLTAEEGESSLLGFLMRDMRWARGNAQWANYLWTKRGLPWGPRVYLGIGILCYLWPLVASVFLLASVFLCQAGTPLTASDGVVYVRVLLVLVASSLLVPKMLGSRSWWAFYLGILGGAAMAPAVMLIQGVLFLLGAFGTKWTIRGSRSSRMDREHQAGILQLFGPVAALGCTLWLCCTPEGSGWGCLLLRCHLTLLVMSPLLGLLFSWPWRVAPAR